VKQKGHHSPGHRSTDGDALLRFEDVYQQLLPLPELTVDDTLRRTCSYHEHGEVSDVRGNHV